jgi:hypothetical protein
MTQKYHVQLSNITANLGYAPSRDVEGFSLPYHYSPHREPLLPTEALKLKEELDVSQSSFDRLATG